jgi:hypothetical protein
LRGIRIYVEGGGDARGARTALRRGFWAFLRELREAAQARSLEWRVIPRGPRGSVFRTFRAACADYPDWFNVLLVDSEGPVSTAPRQHLRQRDNWDVEMPEEHCHLMVQVMEAWIVADRAGLRDFYGQGFRQSAIPKTEDVERIDKARLVEALSRASRDTQKGTYHKIRHAARLLERIDPHVVRSRARHCERLFATLKKVIADGR